ncbi:F-box domain, Leucine-rich repeat domain, L domain-like protein [Artemisia annua]|uniref:F-box domain, Leucine-rich repeat domain, L domain-like protein n=1 Tax=Artemisia annua TaxID=35608 RepID=A0A2U1LZM8_ARTAN|nr:F-box domain, Leucine-rich repeat domain, L domain-like protein [Artemisia annua]
MKNKNVMIKEDRISELPELVIENILLRLVSSKDRVRVSVLSKRWCALTASFPFFDFNCDEFVKGVYGTIYNHDARYLFYKYVEHSVSRFCCQQNLKNVHTFKLCSLFKDDVEVGIINKCLELILEKGLKVLDIDITVYPHLQEYRLPIRPSSRVSSLTSLTLSQHVLPSSLMVDDANLHSLKVLWLNKVTLDPVVTKNLTSSCPLLEKLIVEYCYGVKKFSVYGRLQNLKKFRFIDNKFNGVERIDIEAPYLYECHLSVRPCEGATSVKLGSCKQLRTLYLDGSFFPTSIGFSEFFNNFPFIENLSLSLHGQCNSLVVSSPSLRKFVLYDECDLEEIDINTPNLILFSYANECNFRNPCKFKKIDLGELNARMECHIINGVDSLWFKKLRQFLESANRFKVLKLDNSFLGKISVDFNQLKVTGLLPYELEHVELKLFQEKVLTVLDGILWCCRPRSLSLTSNFSFMSDKKRSHFLKFISAKLLQQEDKGQTNIQIEWSFPSNAETYFSWNSMMPELPDHNKLQTLTFIKEEGPFQEEEKNETVKGLQMLRLRICVIL